MGGVDGIDGVGDGLTQQRLKILKKGGWMDGVDGWMGWGGWTDCGGGVARESGGMGWTGGWRGVSASELWTDSERVGWMGGHTKKNIHTLPPPLSPPSLLPPPKPRQQEAPMELLAAGGMGNEALTELLRVEVRWCLGLISYSAYIYNNTHHTIITTTTPPPHHHHRPAAPTTRRARARARPSPPAAAVPAA